MTHLLRSRSPFGCAIGRPVIKAFNNILAKSLLEKAVPKGMKGRIALSVVGDSLDAKAAVLHLVNDLGFDAVDGGDLDSYQIPSVCSAHVPGQIAT